MNYRGSSDLFYLVGLSTIFIMVDTDPPRPRDSPK